jgi:hypothetical protein
MAKRKKRAAARKTKSKRAKTARKSVKRAVGRKSRRTAKKVAGKTSRKRVSARKRATPPRRQAVPVVEGEIIDVVDEPLPGVVRVTEIEATRVTLPDSKDDAEE